MNPKDLVRAYAVAYPMPRGCSVDLYISSDYGMTFTQTKQAGGMIMNILNSIFAIFRPSNVLNKKLFQWRVLFTSRQLATTTLSAAITSSSQTSISVTSGANIGNGDTIGIDFEQMIVTAGGGTSTLTVTRGWNAITHSNGATVNDFSVAPQLTAVGMRKVIKQLDA